MWPQCSTRLVVERNAEKLCVQSDVSVKRNSDSAISTGNINSAVVAASLLFQFLYQTSDHLTTLQACSFVCTTLCTVLGQLNHKTGITVPEKQHD
jgi:hypothetical protein